MIFYRYAEEFDPHSYTSCLESVYAALTLKIRTHRVHLPGWKEAGRVEYLYRLFDFPFIDCTMDYANNLLIRNEELLNNREAALVTSTIRSLRILYGATEYHPRERLDYLYETTKKYKNIHLSYMSPLFINGDISYGESLEAFIQYREKRAEIEASKAPLPNGLKLLFAYTGYVHGDAKEVSDLSQVRREMSTGFSPIYYSIKTEEDLLLAYQFYLGNCFEAWSSWLIAPASEMPSKGSFMNVTTKIAVSFPEYKQISLGVCQTSTEALRKLQYRFAPVSSKCILLIAKEVKNLYMEVYNEENT